MQRYEIHLPQTESSCHLRFFNEDRGKRRLFPFRVWRRCRSTRDNLGNRFSLHACRSSPPNVRLFGGEKFPIRLSKGKKHVLDMQELYPFPSRSPHRRKEEGVRRFLKSAFRRDLKSESRVSRTKPQGDSYGNLPPRFARITRDGKAVLTLTSGVSNTRSDKAGQHPYSHNFLSVLSRSSTCSSRATRSPWRLMRK